MSGCGIGDILGQVVRLLQEVVLPFISSASMLEKNFKELEGGLQTLDEEAGRVLKKVYADESKRDKAAEWLFDAAECQKEATGLMDRFRGMPPWRRRGGIFSRHQASTDAGECLGRVKSLLDSVRGVSGPEDRILEVAVTPTLVGIDSKVKKLKDFVKGPSMIMGVWGMAGVGKATLVKKLNNDLYVDFESYADRENFLSGRNFSEALSAKEKGSRLLRPEDHFDVVIFLGEEMIASEDDIQQGIAKRLGLASESNEGTPGADAISKALRSMKFLIIMVGLRNYLNLQNLGIPSNGHPGSKVIFTTQEEPVHTKICNAFSHKKDKIHLRCLKWQPAWKLFMKKLEDSNGTNESAAEEIVKRTNERAAKEIVKICGGLPIALEAIANRMASKKHDERAWSTTLRFLETNPKPIHELAGTVIQKLQLSYDYQDKNTQKCLLYCALFTEKRGIKRDWLVQYLIGDGRTRRSDPELREIITKLTELSLLERVFPKDDDEDDDDDGNDGRTERGSHADDDSSGGGDNKSDDDDDDDERYSVGGAGGDDDEDNVRMHSMYRVLALWLKPDKLVVQTRADKPGREFGNWKKAERVSLMMNDLNPISKGISECSELKTLVLNGNKLHDIPSSFFHSTPPLKVLDLSSTAIEELPPEIERLENLVCLNLYKSKLKKLPEGLKHLKKLRFLNLGYTIGLKEIPHEVISSLGELRVLIMYASYGAWDVDSSGDGVKLEELEKLTSLKELAITIEKEKVLKKLCATPGLADITSRLLIRGCQGMHSFQLPQPLLSRLCMRRVVDCPDLEVLEIGNPGGMKWTGETQEWKLELKGIPTANIKWTGNVSENKWLQYLTWLSITSCSGIEGRLIGNSTKKNDGQKRKIEIFGKLRYLELDDLRGLDSIYDCLLPFPSLRTFKVLRCPKLKKLPFTEDGAQNLRHIYCEKHWWDELREKGENLYTRLKDHVEFVDGGITGE